MKNRTWKYHLIGAVLIILGFGTGEAVSGKSDIYADISKYSHFVYARYDFGTDSQPAGNDCGIGNFAGGHWLQDATGRLLGPFAQLPHDSKEKDTSQWTSLDRRYSMPDKFSAEGELIAYCLEIKASLDSPPADGDTIASVGINWVDGQDSVRAISLGYIMSYDFTRESKLRPIILWFQLDGLVPGEDFENNSVKVQLEIAPIRNHSLKFEWIKIYDTVGLALVECPAYIREIRACLKTEYRIDGKVVGMYPGPEYPTAHMIMTGEFEDILSEYRRGRLMKLKSSDF